MSKRKHTTSPVKNSIITAAHNHSCRLEADNAEHERCLAKVILTAHPATKNEAELQFGYALEALEQFDRSGGASGTSLSTIHSAFQSAYVALCA
jgi:hypothetical protein